ncbi:MULTISPECIES: UDP-N-acetylglucosamine 2-epimerase [Phyllobacteriaceae]|jgi:GDP/UDP-N,N'-diacetylbacillosamine 2-epimerase (hydrolysing)|uniref:UDP-N-acetyl-D-glucosamine 2-epimerase, UDP-hydrolysing n=1 Tax=Mesorhizobium hungaricum TaxID=1566387 RepID=A0A1C2DJI1_9HYPH|nr:MULTISPECIES: UDP-N-acetylglucosamine 2-epimerase [Mesorhizobium]MBN9233209.1 UDP-N-acetylglucosamine 2-epimerase (hydrolyzing) [Mesorhizobium sp.]MDQ0332104.1 GDP/UDP-N,N'-diacetylbacillosamine 2-epimerase (hydrolyzing) [Mesorhizobium sp. YL-MeA3-2017]OCX14815.1 UDP-N-acetyl-D-glucosamine 2-epimerase, UDP-hydrolysing [Mesorhizobium hungaricum]
MRAVRKVCYVTGTRADFGLMKLTLERIHGSSALDLSLLVTGMHLSTRYGLTVREIVASGLPIGAQVEVEDDIPSGPLMARNIGRMLVGFVDALEVERPDIVLLLGDRGEMLAAAIAALHLGIPVAHVHGGERSGTVDEPVRHAISKLSRFHLTATEESRQRLVSMGEPASQISVVGAPGLDGLTEIATKSREQICADFHLEAAGKIALLLYHPVVQEAATGGADIARIIAALRAYQFQILALMPNSDAGSDEIRKVLDEASRRHEIKAITHLARSDFVSTMKEADLMIGNSSSGIIEAASFGTPVVNIGSRQNLRQRNSNVIDVKPTEDALNSALEFALKKKRFAKSNVYGDGSASMRIVSFLSSVRLDALSLVKENTY